METSGSAAAGLLTQIHVGRGRDGYEAVSSTEADKKFYIWEQETVRAKLMRLCPPRLWPKASYNTACPRPILINKKHQQQLKELSDALVVSVTDIVNRWWFDREAALHARMPLNLKEEELLQYGQMQNLAKKLPDFAACRGSWRPDFLVNEVTNADGTTVENFVITEINARFSFNGFMHAAYGQLALDDMGLERHGLASATDAKELVDGLFGLFRRDRPLHLLKGEEAGIDVHMVVEAVRRRLGVVPRFVNLADLRVKKNDGHNSGSTLCAIYRKPQGSAAATSDPSPTLFTLDGELVEEIHQVGLELHQRELLALPKEILRQIGLRCFNDMRTIFLVHDKRMLGIIKQELLTQVMRGVLTPRQADILQKGVVDTILPRSPELLELQYLWEEFPELRKEFILKPIRSGKGDGIVFGDEISNQEWLAAVERQLSPDLEFQDSCVIQRRIIPRLYDVVLDRSGQKQRCPLVGTYHIVNGVFLGFGIWRSSNDRICAVSHGGAWICSVMRKDKV